MNDQKEELQFEKAEYKDAELLFGWINDPETRAQSLSDHIISFDEHMTWFSKKLIDKNCYLYIVYKNSSPAGMIRFDTNGDESTISYLVDKVQRGKGVGSLIINKGITHFAKESGFKGILKAVVKEINIASLKIFDKATFKKENYNEGLICFKKLIV